MKTIILVLNLVIVFNNVYGAPSSAASPAPPIPQPSPMAVPPSAQTPPPQSVPLPTLSPIPQPSPFPTAGSQQNTTIIPLPPASAVLNEQQETMNLAPTVAESPAADTSMASIPSLGNDLAPLSTAASSKKSAATENVSAEATPLASVLSSSPEIASATMNQNKICLPGNSEMCVTFSSG